HTRQLEPSTVPWRSVIGLFIGNADKAPPICLEDLQSRRLRGRHDVDHTLRAHCPLNTAAAAHIICTLHGIPLPSRALARVMDDLNGTPLLVGDRLKHANDTIHADISLADRV